MTVKQINTKLEIERVVHDAAAKIRETIEEAKAAIAKLGGDEEADEARIIELVTEAE